MKGSILAEEETALTFLWHTGITDLDILLFRHRLLKNIPTEKLIIFKSESTENSTFSAENQNV